MFTLKIETINAAFGDNHYDKVVEITNILEQIRQKLQNGETNGNIRDLNGNTVGIFDLS